MYFCKKRKEKKKKTKLRETSKSSRQNEILGSEIVDELAGKRRTTSLPITVYLST